MTVISTRTYLSYELPGSFYPESESRLVVDRDPLRDAVSAPSRAFSLRYYDIVVVHVWVNGEEVETKSPTRNRSKRYVINGKVLSVEDVERLPGDHGILLSNMRGNGWSHVLQHKTGNFQPFDPADDELIYTAD